MEICDVVLNAFALVLTVLLAGIAAIVTAFVMALFNCVRAFYTTLRSRQDVLESKNSSEKGNETMGEEEPEPARRSYFLGHGYLITLDALKNAFSENSGYKDQLDHFSDFIRGDTQFEFMYADSTFERCRSAAGPIFKNVSHVFLYIFSAVLSVTVRVLIGFVFTIITIFMFFMLTVVWLVDHFYLLIKHIFSDCPACHRRYLVPAFRCPDCGRLHKKLYPNIYGILHHRCVCGARIPSTFITGRSSLEGICPVCGTQIVATNARPLSFQLIGATGTGKTVFLAASFHLLRERISETSGVKSVVPKPYRAYFNELENYYNGEFAPGTVNTNAQMYPLMIKPDKGINRMFTIYDIAGETFRPGAAEKEIQRQFGYSGLLFLIDPYCSMVLREEREKKGGSMTDFVFNNSDTKSAVTDFITQYNSIRRGKPDASFKMPVAVLIAKADAEEVRERIGYDKIENIYINRPDKGTTYEEVRDQACRDFLHEIQLTEIVNDIEGTFNKDGNKTHYFPVSSIGHAGDGSVYTPWGIMDVYDWLISLADKELAQAMNF